MLPVLSFVAAGEWLAFAASALLLGFCSLTVARRLGTSTAERLWISLAAAVAQVATICVVLSPARLLTPIAFLLLQLVITGAVLLAVRRRTAAPRTHERRRHPAGAAAARPPALVERVLLGLSGVLVLSAIALAALTPVNHFDDRAYRASRAAYWLQHRSLMPWESHNDRQTAFPFGSELLFFWPVLFTRAELPGRVAFAAGVPLCAIGLYTVLRQARASRTAALAGVLLLLAAPAFIYLQGGLFPDLWMTVFALGAAFYAVRASAHRGRRAIDFVMIGFFAALAVNTKTTALSLVPAACVAPWLSAAMHPRVRVRGTGLVLAGCAAGAVLSGLGFVLATNTWRDGHPLGPPAMRRWHTADISPTQLRTHAARLVVSLIDVPFALPPPIRHALGSAGRVILRLLGAADVLPMEEPTSRWPGSYAYGAPIRPSTFSLAGIAWLPALFAAVVVAIRSGIRKRRSGTRKRPDRSARDMLILAVLSASMLAGTVFIVRWMGQSERFRVAAYALGVPVIVLLCQRAVRRWPWFRFVAAALLLVMVLPATLDHVRTAAASIHNPLPPRLLDEPLHTPMPHLPPGSRILLVGAQDTRDYGLFRPRDGFANEVVSWGKAPFDAQRMSRMLAEHRITHVLVQDQVQLWMEWDPPLRTAEMVRWLAAQPGLVDLRVDSPGMRLFARRDAATTARSPALASRYNGGR